MKVSEASIAAIQKIVTGDPVGSERENLVPYRRGFELVNFFNEFGFQDEYTQGFPARWSYTEEKLRDLNGTDQLEKVIAAALDPRQFLETPMSPDRAAAYVNQYLEFDDYKVVKVGRRYVVRKLGSETVQLGTLFGPSQELRHGFIEEQLKKCDDKITVEDYSGAITNARSLLEAVLLEVEERVGGKAVQYDGDLPRLYKRVQALLNLDPSRSDVSDAVKRILGGFANVVAGLAPLRNVMSDAHALDYKPQRHHATLAVNAAKTVVDFLFESLQYQLDRGNITLPR